VGEVGVGGGRGMSKSLARARDAYESEDASQAAPSGNRKLARAGKQQSFVGRSASVDKFMTSADRMPSMDRGSSDFAGGDKKLARKNGMTESADKASKRDRENPYFKDPKSMDTYRSITQPRTQKMMRKIPPKLYAYGKHHGSLLGQQSHMTYAELLSGMFFDDEILAPVRPLMIANYRVCDATVPGWPVQEEKFGLRLFLTNKRVFFLDADLHELPTLDRPEQEVDDSFWLVDRLKCTYRTDDELFYYPIPLSNLTGMTLDIHYMTQASGWLYGSRPRWAVCCGVAGCCLALIATLEALLVWGTVDRAIQGKSGEFVPVLDFDDNGIPVGLNDSRTYEWEYDKYHGEFLVGLDMRQALTLIVGYALCCIAPCAYFNRISYTRSQFRPKMKQRRQILIGAKDPISQEQKAYKLLLDNRYETMQIKEYVHLMQKLCPELAGMVLRD
jgi:hypothetical protein